jgi:hypothetical protein
VRPTIGSNALRRDSLNAVITFHTLTSERHRDARRALTLHYPQPPNPHPTSALCGTPESAAGPLTVSTPEQRSTASWPPSITSRRQPPARAIKPSQPADYRYGTIWLATSMTLRTFISGKS